MRRCENTGMEANEFAELVAALESVGAAITSQSGLIDLLAQDNSKQWDAIAALRDDLHAVASVRAPEVAMNRMLRALGDNDE